MGKLLADDNFKSIVMNDYFTDYREALITVLAGLSEDGVPTKGDKAKQYGAVMEQLAGVNGFHKFIQSALTAGANASIAIQENEESKETVQ